MSQLVVIEFPDEHTAFAVRAELAKLQKRNPKCFKNRCLKE
ncbi:MAG: hypothetical protein WBV95_03830 [Desulfobacterales bacterium]|jgi:uncharacterized membrane protein